VFSGTFKPCSINPELSYLIHTSCPMR